MPLSTTLPFDPTLGLRAELDAARALTDATFRRVADEALYERPIPERHRLVFYLGHLEAFDRNLLERATRADEPAPHELDLLFAFGIDPVGRPLPADAPSEWPRLEHVRAYVRRTRRSVDASIEAMARGGGLRRGDGARDAVEMLLEHRLMHAETLAYLLHQLPLRSLRPPAAAVLAEPMPRTSTTAPRTVAIAAGPTTLGRTRGGDAFGWDNEFDSETTWVPEFAIDLHPVTNGSFLEFVRAGGYSERSLWSDADWAWLASAGLEHPRFWRPDGDGVRLRTFSAEIPLPTDWPVYASHAEASAYARWRGRALPTEAQWQRAAYGAPEADLRFPWGDEAPSPVFGNFDFLRDDPTPTAAHPAGASPFGIEDLLGNGWEWTSTPFAPLRGFEASPLYPGYSRDFFDGKHFVLKGGSPRTARRLLRRTFRNWFQPHYPYAYATFRCTDR